MISINRLEEMAIEELQTELKNFEEQIKLQNNFIDSLLKATNNSEWVDKSMLDDEVSEVIEKIELDYEQLDQLKAENKELKRYKSLFEKARDLWNEASRTNYKLLDEIEDLKDSLKRTICQSECYRYKEAEKLKQTLTEIKEIAEHCIKQDICTTCDYSEECNLGDEEIPTYDICKFLLNKINQHQ